MPAPACFLGIDIGPSAITCLLLDRSGTEVGVLRRQHRSARLDDRDEEVDPQVWWRATRTAIKDLLRRTGVEPGRIRGLGVTGDTDAAVLLDAAGHTLAPSAFGVCTTGIRGLERLLRLTPARNCHNLTGSHPRPGALLPKLLQQRASHPRVAHDLHLALQPPEFLRYRLTGVAATDLSGASRSLLFSSRQRVWSKQLLKLCDLSTGNLPKPMPAGSLIGRVDERAARQCGLPAGTPVIAGATPLIATALATGTDRAGEMTLELGGDGGALCLDRHYHRCAPDIDTGCHGDLWSLQAHAVSPTTGIDWLMQTVLPAEVQQARRRKRDPLDHLAEIAAEIRPGADGLLFFPPENGSASGFIGLRPDHARGHLVRAVLEATALDIRALTDRLREAHITPRRLTAIGPGAGNPLWCQMVADATEHGVRALPQPALPARGMATLAAVATGAYPGLDQARRDGVRPVASYRPRKAATATYHRIRPRRHAIRSALDKQVPATISIGPEGM